MRLILLFETQEWAVVPVLCPGTGQVPGIDHRTATPTRRGGQQRTATPTRRGGHGTTRERTERTSRQACRDRTSA